MNLPHKQKGLSSIGWLFVGVTLFFYGIILAKVVPVYLDDMSVASAIEKLNKISTDSIDPTPEVITALEKQFDVNNIRDIDLKRQGVVKVERKSGVILVELKYDKVISIFKDNGMLQTVDMVVSFKHKQQIKQ